MNNLNAEARRCKEKAIRVQQLNNSTTQQLNNSTKKYNYEKPFHILQIEK
jgi:hypothetical protein